MAFGKTGNGLLMMVSNGSFVYMIAMIVLEATF